MRIIAKVSTFKICSHLMPNSRSARAHGHRRKDIVAHDAAGDGPGSRGRSEGGSRRGEGKDSEGEFHGAGGSMTKIVSIMRPVTATRPLPHPPASVHHWHYWGCGDLFRLRRIMGAWAHQRKIYSWWA